MNLFSSASIPLSRAKKHRAVFNEYTDNLVLSIRDIPAAD